MKRFSSLLFLCICFSGCSLKLGLSPKEDKSKYVLAYDYIVQDQLGREVIFKVADSTVKIDFSPFYEELSSHLRKSKEAMLMQLDSLNQVSQAELKVNNSQLIKKNEQNKPNYILYFSKEYYGSLVAEVLVNGDKRESYQSATAFNKGTRYLFVFDSIGKLKSVYKKEIQYN